MQTFKRGKLMDEMTLLEHVPQTRAFSRRRFLAVFLTLAAYLRLTRPASASQELDKDETVLSGRWLLKRSDLR